jgi:hypothetical protein
MDKGRELNDVTNKQTDFDHEPLAVQDFIEEGRRRRHKLGNSLATTRGKERRRELYIDAWLWEGAGIK